MHPPIPVILDTDLGTDIDDTWALAFLLRCPELDLKLITTTTGDTAVRAALAARLLQAAGRTDIPIGIGVPLEDLPIYQREWVAGYDLADYPGQIIPDGVGALADAVLRAPTPPTVIGIGPLPNLAAALQRAPQIAQRARFVGMHGSIHRGYANAPEPAAEYNVKLYPHSCRTTFAAPWTDITLSPLDTCGVIQLTGAKYQAVRRSADPLTRAVLENYACWIKHYNPIYGRFNPETESTILFDLAPIYLAFAEALVEIEALPIAVSDDGYTRIDPRGPVVRCATRWKDLGAFEDLVVERLA